MAVSEIPAVARRDLRTPTWIALAILAVGLQLVLYPHSGYSWHYFTEAATLLIGQHPPGDLLMGGLHLYANYPQLQFGPLSILSGVLLLPFSDAGWFLVSWFMTLCGLAVLYLLERSVRVLRPDLDLNGWPAALTMLVGGTSFVISWELLAVHFSHLDDVIALVLLAIGLFAAVERSPVLTGLCVGLAVDAKPWALACAALLLGFPLRQAWRAIAVAAVVICAAWLPFILGDPHTLSAAASFSITNSPASALRALGVTDATTPSWDRIAQIGVGCVLGVIAIVRRRFPAVVALGIAARIALDPSVYGYYTAGLAFGVLLWDLVSRSRPIPILGALCLIGLTMAPVGIHDQHLLGELRLWTVVIVAAAMLLLPRHSEVAKNWVAASSP